MKKMFMLIMVAVMAISVAGCSSTHGASTDKEKEVYKVIATTTMLADLVNVIGGDKVEVTGLMGPGIDPHLYKASAGDVTAMQEADMVVYNGLHLEGKMGEIFENLEANDKLIVCITDGIDEKRLVTDEESGGHDPHVWFDVALWKDASKNLYNGLVALDPKNESTYTKNYEAYKKELEELDTYVKEQVELVDQESRVLITAHDAFAYFGKAYGFEVKGLQGISTASEAGTADVKELVDFIVEHKIKAIFVESSVPVKNIEALQEAVEDRGFQVEIGGELFSDSLGTEGTEADTYIGTVRSNIDTIVGALK